MRRSHHNGWRNMLHIQFRSIIKNLLPLGKEGNLYFNNKFETCNRSNNCKKGLSLKKPHRFDKRKWETCNTIKGQS